MNAKRTTDTPNPHAICPATCPRCAVHALGLTPGFTLATAAMLIPCSTRALAQHLQRHKSQFPPRFRRQGLNHWVRILWASEFERIRAAMLRTGPGSRHPHYEIPT